MAKSANVHIIVGNDGALVRQRATETVTRLVGPQPDDFAFDVYEEGESGPTPELVWRALRSVRTPPFLGGPKTVWLKHFSALDAESSKSSDIGKALRELSALIAAGIPADIVLVIDGECKDTKKLLLLKACRGKAEVTELNRPERGKYGWEAQMTELVTAAAQAKGLTLRRDATEYLLGVLGTETSRIDSELEKLLCYRGEPGEVTLDEVSAICSGQGDEYAWTFTNAVGARDLEGCLRIIGVMSQDPSRDAEKTARSLLTTMAGHFRESLQIQIFMSQNRAGNPAGLRRLIESASAEQKESWKAEGNDFVTFNTYRILKMAEKAVAYHPRELIRAISAIGDAVLQCNSSSTEVRAALESLLFAIVPRPRTAPGRP